MAVEKKSMKTHILGACGTFMAGIAQLAKSLSHEVTGVDQNVYPPMSDLLEKSGIKLISGYETYAAKLVMDQLDSDQPDTVVIGNALSRGNSAVELVLNKKLPYISGPQWLFENILSKTKVLAVSGTHGKTSTSSMLAWILDYAGYNPGFLIGGIPKNFNCSARLGGGEYFVLEADEYDSAFFDKRSKFVHYHPDVLVINNIEFDHADIFNNLDEIKKQFHHVIRTVPGDGSVIYNGDDQNISDVLKLGLWSKSDSFRATSNNKINDETGWASSINTADGSSFSVLYKNTNFGEVNWQMHGEHNITNALAATSAAYQVGIKIETAIEALNQFQGIKRRQELIAQVGSVKIYEDFAHHPTAIKTTLEGFQKQNNKGRLIILLELASNTMKSGCHNQELIEIFGSLDNIYFYSNQKDNSNIEHTISNNNSAIAVYKSLEKLELDLARQIKPEDTIIIMSNGSFGNIYKTLPAMLEQRNL